MGDFGHLLHKAAMHDKLILVPLPSNKEIHILDSCTGDGLTDINPTHCEHIQSFPASITFRKQDILESWPEGDQSRYDLVHQRFCLSQWAPEKDAEIIKDLFNLAKPRGYKQLSEADTHSFKGGEEHSGMTKFMEYTARAFPEMRKATADNIVTIFNSFAAFEAKMPNYWYSQEAFKALKDSVADEMENIGNTWKFWVATERRQ
ncbi:hypothetical protein GQ43DRAFT_448605 [Delitschia confertaspora ATCC 74209]|uniref:Methyltransferase domain-containing protein n=1 Tax=Delitschia confertaspora ATCC 74209 TaxID=1513339 RepID=A0A9P4JP32_9PLEO|nr:hypothetical protein GQ43DRAFT_448605 [Delitschia confertaspora ATCC 74209]